MLFLSYIKTIYIEKCSKNIQMHSMFGKFRIKSRGSFLFVKKMEVLSTMRRKLNTLKRTQCLIKYEEYALKCLFEEISIN